MVLPYINMYPPQVYMCSPSLWVIPVHQPQASSIMHRTWTGICFLYDIIHVSMPFSQIILPSPSPTESKRLFYTSVSLLLSYIQGYRYHLSKFHIYVLVYCIGVFLSGLLHSVQLAPVSNIYKWNITFKNCESLYYTPLTYIILYINYTSIKDVTARAQMQAF